MPATGRRGGTCNRCSSVESDRIRTSTRNGYLVATLAVELMLEPLTRRFGLDDTDIATALPSARAFLWAFGVSLTPLVLLIKHCQRAPAIQRSQKQPSILEVIRVESLDFNRFNRGDADIVLDH